MNMLDFKPIDFTWDEIFEKQKELKFLYEPSAKELFDNFDIDCYEDQEAFKRYCWRITEELVEAMEALSEESLEHAKEEVIDALNFSIELLLLYGWSKKDVYNVDIERLDDEFKTTIYYLGLTANCLKNRQWRRSQYMVDLLTFEKRLHKFAAMIFELCRFFFSSDEEIRKAWSLKYQVNLFRIKSNY